MTTNQNTGTATYAITNTANKTRTFRVTDEMRASRPCDSDRDHAVMSALAINHIRRERNVMTFVRLADAE